MPVSLATLFRALVVLLMAAHIFYMYGTARTIGDGVGFRPGVVLGSAAFALVMMIPLVWAVTVPEWPEIYTRFRAQRRWHAGRCAACGYARAGIERVTCPECDAPLSEPPGHTFSLRTIRRFAILALAAWLLGATGAEGWIIADERAFAAEVQARAGAGQVVSSHARPRRWPGGGSWLRYEPGRGFFASR